MSIEKIISTLPNRTAAERAAMRCRAIDKLDAGDAKYAVDAGRLLTALNELEASEGAERIAAAQARPEAERVIYAFEILPMSALEERLIQVLLDNPGSSNRDLSRGLGWKDNGWDMWFGMLCRDRMHYLWPAKLAPARNAPFYCGILADLQEPENLFTMKPFVAASFSEMGLRRRS